jgi:putative hydrolase of the HAD superfamily
MFAIDGTLYDTPRAVQEGLQDCLGCLRQGLGELPPHLTIAYLECLHRQVMLEHRTGPVTPFDCRHESLRRALLTLQRSQARWIETLARTYARQRFNPRYLYPDALAALPALKRRFNLGVVSNGDTYLDRIGMERMFSLRMYTRGLPWRKPDPRLFEIFRRGGGGRAGEFVFIGDDPRNDVDGPRRCGFPVIWLNRKHDQFPRQLFPPNLMIRTLDQLPGGV